MTWAKYESLFDPPKRKPPKSGGFKTKKPIDIKNSARARKLLTAIHHQNKIKRNLENDPNYHKGISAFATLSRELDNDHRLDQVLNWYCSHLQLEFIPEILSPYDFKSKFLRVENAMRRYARLRPKLVISAAARRLCRKFYFDRQPKKYQLALELLMQISLTNVRRTFIWIEKKYQLPSEIIPFPADFVYEYIDDITDWACGKYQTDYWWEKVDPVNLAFRSNTHRCKRALKLWAKEVQMETELIDEIIKGVNECVSMK